MERNEKKRKKINTILNIFIVLLLALIIFRIPSKRLTDEELEIVEDAKNLIRQVDENIVFKDFNIYKVNYRRKFNSYGWTTYNEKTGKCNIYIPFKTLERSGKDFCFMVVLHEILHAQNLQDNIYIFDDAFLEGLNQYLTDWLIENYSDKYLNSKKACIANLGILYITAELTVYPEEIKTVEEIIEKSNIDIEELFLNYINFNPEYFKNFVPPEHLKNNEINKEEKNWEVSQFFSSFIIVVKIIVV